MTLATRHTGHIPLIPFHFSTLSRLLLGIALLLWGKECRANTPDGDRRMDGSAYSEKAEPPTASAADAMAFQLFQAVESGDRSLVQRLLARGALPTWTDGSGKTGLMAASEHKDRAMVRLLVKAGAPLKATDARGRNALHYAAAPGNSAVVGMLMKYGVDSLARDNTGQTPLMVAVSFGHFSAVRKLLDARQLKDSDGAGRSLLYHAYRSGNMGLITYLKRKGAPTEMVPRNRSSLFMAAVQSPNLKLVERMAVSHDVNETNLSGETPLFLAALNGRRETVAFLMAQGARVELGETTNGQTMLIAAAALGDAEFLRRIIIKGVNVNRADNSGRTALYYAVSRADEDCSNLLLKYGADPNVADNQGVSPVEMAVRHQNPLLVQSLLKAGAIPRGSMQNGESLLMTATRLGNEQIVGELLGAGASIHTVSADGTTLLMVASQEGMTDFVRLLLQWGQHPSTTNQAGESALDMAKAFNHVDVVSILEAGMANTP